MKLQFSAWPRENHERVQRKDRIVFLHGLGGTGSLWRPITARLESDFSLLAPDQRGHGGSREVPPEDFDFSPLQYGKDVIETLEAENFHPAWLVGHSMGVRTACAAAALRPEWVRGLVLIDLGLWGPAGGGLNEMLDSFLRILPASFATRAEARAFIQKHSPDAAIGQYLLAVSVQTSGGALTFPFDHQALLKTLEDARNSDLRPWVQTLGEHGMPILLLRGARSEVWTHEQFEAEKLRFAHLPSIQFREIEGAGHGLPFEKREEFTTLLREFCGKTH